MTKEGGGLLPASSHAYRMLSGIGRAAHRIGANIRRVQSFFRFIIIPLLPKIIKSIIIAKETRCMMSP
jgi:hypothetical protein